MFTVYNSVGSTYRIHDGNTVTIDKLISGENETYQVSRYNAEGELVSWVAHVSELSNFDGVDYE